MTTLQKNKIFAYISSFNYVTLSTFVFIKVQRVLKPFCELIILKIDIDFVTDR